MKHLDQYNFDKPGPDPARLRAVFGDNLRRLCEDYPSVSAVCRHLGINRTQFNRYLSGDSFPRPDILFQICTYFGVDARVLLERLEDIRPEGKTLFSHNVLEEFFGHRIVNIPTGMVPSGFYRFVRYRASDICPFAVGLFHVWRQNDFTFLRGYDYSRRTLRDMGITVPVKSREYRGIFSRQESGVVAQAANRDVNGYAYNYLQPVHGYDRHILNGYNVRTLDTSVPTRILFEHLADDTELILKTARAAGHVKLGELEPYHRDLLDIGGVPE